MSLKTFVKISNVDNLSDARYCAGMMVDVLGFNTEEGTEGFVDPEKFSEITNWVAGVKFCGEFKNAHIAEIKLALTNYQLDFIETQSIDHLEELSGLGVNVIFKLRIKQLSDLDCIESQLNYSKDLAKHVVVSSDKESLFDLISDKLVAQNKEHISLIKGYELYPEKISGIENNLVFSGVELTGSPEERPGFKDYDSVMDILDILDDD